MEYVVQAFKVLKTLVHAEANVRTEKPGFFVAFLTQITQTRFLCVITNQFYACLDFALIMHEICKLISKGAFVIVTERPLGISLQIACSN